MKYADHISSIVRKMIASRDHVFVFGQNVTAGSRIGGLTRGFSVNENSRIINMTNSENSIVGFGFGIMLGGGFASFFMKQLDFLLLGLDQIVNTYGLLRNSGHARGAFTIVTTVVDAPNQGPHSSSNNFADFCSMAKVPGFTITNKYDAEKILETYFFLPGFRIIGVSHRFLKEEIMDPGAPVFADKEMKFVQYKEGNDVTVACFNFSLPYGWKLAQELEKIGKKPALFNVNYMTPIDWTPILASAKKTKRIVIMDDSQSENLSCFSLLADARKLDLIKELFLVSKPIENWFNPVSSLMDMDYAKVARDIIP